MTHATGRDALRELIDGALKRSYTSESCQDAIKTGNHYQSIALGESSTTGFRTQRAEFLDRIDFEGQKVLDLGANLGEMSRGARARGASLVDGFEYDPYFIEIADLVSAFNETTRVSFYRRDITDPEIYRERYDIVLAFSVFIYIDKVIEQLAKFTDVLVIETHKLVGNLDETYIDPVSEFFPVYELLGTTEWGTMHDKSVERAVLVFAKNQKALNTVLLADEAQDGGGRAALATPEPATGQIDVTRTCLQHTFFDRFPGDSTEEVLAAVAAHPLDLDEQASSEDARLMLYSGWTYWFLFLRGWLQYRDTGTIGPENVHVRYLITYFGQQTHDPGMGERLSEPANAMVAASSRFRDLSYFARGPKAAAYVPAPVRLWVEDPPAAHTPSVFITGREDPLLPRSIDGWHRLFAASLFRSQEVPCEFFEYRAEPGQTLGEVERISCRGRTIEVSGWCLHPHREVHAFELRMGNQTLARTSTAPRDDVRVGFEDIRHARWTGYALEAELDEEVTGPVELELVPLADWFAVARARIHYDPVTQDEPNRPPVHLGRRLVGRDDPNALAVRTSRAVGAMREALHEHVDLATVDAVLELGVDTGWLTPCLATEFEGASVTGIGFDQEAVDWLAASSADADFVLAPPELPTAFSDEQFDLIVSWSTVSRLAADAPLAWWAELYRLARPGAYVLVGVQGELLRNVLESRTGRQLERHGIADVTAGVRGKWQPPAPMCQARGYTVSTCSDWFDVVDYKVGALVDVEDLVVMRKP